MGFTSDWFTNNISNFQLCMGELDSRKSFLEVGSYEGRSACWLLQHGLDEDGHLTCIDLFDNEERFNTCMDNLSEHRIGTQEIEIIPGRSDLGLSTLLLDEQSFDFIYIDGSHDPLIVLQDACRAWDLLKDGGVMLFDDYQYPHEDTRSGIDAFLGITKFQHRVLFSNYQIGIKKCLQQ